MSTMKRKRKTQGNGRRVPRMAKVRTFDDRVEAETVARSLQAPTIYGDYRNGFAMPLVFTIQAATGLKSRTRARGWLRTDGKIR